jgi:hypothetical protein
MMPEDFGINPIHVKQRHWQMSGGQDEKAGGMETVTNGRTDRSG